MQVNETDSKNGRFQQKKR